MRAFALATHSQMDKRGAKEGTGLAAGLNLALFVWRKPNLEGVK
jgi:hypothetical protein